MSKEKKRKIQTCIYIYIYTQLQYTYITHIHASHHTTPHHTTPHDNTYMPCMHTLHASHQITTSPHTNAFAKTHYVHTNMHAKVAIHTCKHACTRALLHACTANKHTPRARTCLHKCMHARMHDLHNSHAYIHA